MLFLRGPLTDNSDTLEKTTGISTQNERLQIANIQSRYCGC